MEVANRPSLAAIEAQLSGSGIAPAEGRMPNFVGYARSSEGLMLPQETKFGFAKSTSPATPVLP